MRSVVTRIAAVSAVLVMIASCSGARRASPGGAGGASGAAEGGGADGGDADDALFLDAHGVACSGGLTCAAAGVACGPTGDGCGGVLQCGDCTPPETCGGGGVPGACGGDAGCVPLDCAGQGVSCGPAGDGCGGLLQCGGCPAPETCGGGGVPGACGGSGPCVPQTCAELGANCGPVADGCGSLLQCGGCASPAHCGGGGVPSVCGPLLDAGACTNLCLQQVPCDAGVTTTVSGTVLAPNGADPLYGALVYVPNAPVAPFPPGVACEQCGAAASGSPLVSAVTGPDGKFQLTDAPAGQDIPLVIQIGRWRRQIVIPSVAACADTPVPATLTRLPKNQGEGDIPFMAFATGSVDALECVIRKIGIDDAEFTLPPSMGGGGRVNLYVTNGADVGPATPSASQLHGSLATLSQYDMVLFPCEGGQIDKPVASRQNVVQYAAAGGRVFATHYSYAWLYDTVPFSGTAVFIVNQAPLPDLMGVIDTSFPKGQAFAAWLAGVGASTTFGQIPLTTVRHDVDGIIAPSQRWISADPAVSSTAVMHYTFNTPVGAPPAAQCGRVLFDDFHVEDAPTTGNTFPGECPGGPMTPQEKMLEFMLFDLSSCITPDTPSPTPCAPRTCAQQGVHCGPAGDGCGGVVQCGPCPAGQTCGGGGTPGTCGGTSCPPRTCASQGIQCGPAGDGCGAELDCGSCPAGQTCGAGGKPGICGTVPCTPQTCQDAQDGGASCGFVGDGCGGLLSCGTCTPPDSCGGGGTPNVCGTASAQ